MAGIFINYRRDDAPGVAGRLFDYLALRFSHRSLFMDVDAMKPGMDFAEQLDAQVSQCRVVLAIIGPHWLDAKDHSGQRRLDSDRDYVRIELASALKREIPVIPVLVDGAVMPSEENLSEDLKPLARRHALELRHTRFNADADAITRALEVVVPRSRALWRLATAGAIVVVGLVALAVLWPKLSAKLHPSPAPTTVVAANRPPTNPAVPAVPAAKQSSPTPPQTSNATVVAPAAPSKSPAPAVTPAPPSTSQVPATAETSPPAPAGLPANIKLAEIMHGIVLRGSAFRVTEIAAEPALCQSACRADLRCVAWTYTQPAASGLSAHCALKAVIPAQVTDSCCTSAVERVPPPELREPPPVPATVAGARPGIELEGGTYTFFAGNDATPEGCQAACRADGQCLAWDYVRPGIFSADARCFLKNRPSMQVASPCCIAGFERQVADNSTTAPGASANTAPSAAASKAMINTNLFGSDYRNFVMSSDNWSLCQNACKADQRCLAWTAVHPGIQGSKARCWLKSRIPQARANPCCISGIERAAAQ